MVPFSLAVTVVLSLMLLTVVASPAAAQAPRKQALITGGARSALSSVGLAGHFVFITEGYQDRTEWDGNQKKWDSSFHCAPFASEHVCMDCMWDSFVCASLRS